MWCVEAMLQRNELILIENRFSRIFMWGGELVFDILFFNHFFSKTPNSVRKKITGRLNRCLISFKAGGDFLFLKFISRFWTLV